MSHRFQRVQWGPQGERVRTKPATWNKARAWNARHVQFFGQHGRRQRVFCASLADVFDNAVDPAWRADLLDLIDDCPDLDWLLLTKRVGNVAGMLPPGWLEAHPNVWPGATIVNREEMLRDAPKLKALPARVTFWSCEPLLGDLGEIPLELMPSQIIVGGESGPHARPHHPDWPRRIYAQCERAGVAFMFKQHGEWIGVPDLRALPGGQGPGFGAFDHCEYDPVHEAVRVGRKAAGRLLDGRLHDGYPAA